MDVEMDVEMDAEMDVEMDVERVRVVQRRKVAVSGRHSVCASLLREREPRCASLGMAGGNGTKLRCLGDSLETPRVAAFFVGIANDPIYIFSLW